MDPSAVRFPAVVYALTAFPSLITMIVAVSLPRIIVTTNPVFQVSLTPPIFPSTLIIPTSNTTTTNSTITTIPKATSKDSYYISRTFNDTSPIVANATWPTWPIPMSKLLPTDSSVSISWLGFAFGMFDVCATYTLRPAFKPGAFYPPSVGGGAQGGVGPNVWNANRTQYCIPFQEYCDQRRLSGNACGSVKVSQILSISHVVLHALALVAMWVGVSMVGAAAGSRFAASRLLQNQQAQEQRGGSMRWLIRFGKGKEDKSASVAKMGGSVLLGSFALQVLGELFALIMLIISTTSLSQDLLAIAPIQEIFVINPDPVFSLAVSSQLLIITTCLNFIMTLLTFFRYKPILFPSPTKPQTKGKNPSLDPENGENDDEADEIPNRRSAGNPRRSSFDSDFDIALRDENLYNKRFEQWSKSVAQETFSNLPQQQQGSSAGFVPFSNAALGGRSSNSFKGRPVVNTSGAGGGGAGNASLFEGQPSIVHETRSNHSGGSLYHGLGSAGINANTPTAVVFHHETRSNYSGAGGGSIHHAAGVLPAVGTSATTSTAVASPLQVPSVTHRAPSFNLEEGLHQRRRKNSSSSIPASVWKQQQQQVIGAPPLPGIVAVIPPDSENGGPPQLEYIEMKPLSAKAGGRGGIGNIGAGKSVPTMMGTVVFDD
ncbi:hypothetical protein BDR26DRAFT_878081 [Obelidium mucronatum]|nr:hypothetical protein BDR26DRAFT_878081 [Obelidium mucronatum]